MSFPWQRWLPSTLGLALVSQALLSACTPAATPTTMPTQAPVATTAAPVPTDVPVATDAPAETAVPAATDTPAVSGPVSFMVSGDPAQLEAYQTLVAAFEAANPDIKVEVIHIPSDGDYRKRLNADIAAGNPADVILINYRRMAGYAAPGQLTPLTDYIAKSELIKAEDFYPISFDAFKWEGEQMCIPQNISSLVVYYNRDLFKAANVGEPTDDWTWDQFVETAKMLTKDTDGDGAIDQYGLGTETTFIRLAPFIWQKTGGEVMLKNPDRLGLNSVPASVAFQWFADLRNVHGVVPTAEEEASESSVDRFINGRLGMYLDSRRIVPAFRESAAFDWDVAPLPVGDQPATILHSDGYCMPSGAAHKDAAWKLIEFANSPEGQKIIAGTGRTVPSNISVAESEAFLDPNAKPARSQVWLDVIPYIHVLPLVPNWASIEEITDEEVQRAYYGDATVPDAVLSAINRTEEYFVVIAPPTPAPR